MLHLRAYELTETSRDYLLSVLIDPEEIVTIVSKRFEIHLKDLKLFNPSEANSDRVRSTINLLMKDVRLMFELNRSMVDLLKDYEVKVFSDDYLKFAQERLDSALSVFKVVENEK